MCYLFGTSEKTEKLTSILTDVFFLIAIVRNFAGYLITFLRDVQRARNRVFDQIKFAIFPLGISTTFSVTIFEKFSKIDC